MGTTNGLDESSVSVEWGKPDYRQVKTECKGWEYRQNTNNYLRQFCYKIEPRNWAAVERDLKKR